MIECAKLKKTSLRHTDFILIICQAFLLLARFDISHLSFDVVGVQQCQLRYVIYKKNAKNTVVHYHFTSLASVTLFLPDVPVEQVNLTALKD